MNDKSKPTIPDSSKSSQTLINIAVLLLVLATCVYVAYEVKKSSPSPSGGGTSQNTGNPPLDNSASLQGLAKSLILSGVPRGILDFGKQMTGTTSGVQTVTLTAQPEASVKITVATPPDGDFVLNPSSCELAPSESCAVNVSFAPKHTTKIESSLSISVEATPAAAPANNAPPTANPPPPPRPGAPTNKPAATGNNQGQAAPPATPNKVTHQGVILLTGEGTAGCPTAEPVFPQRGWFTPTIPMLITVLIYLVVLILLRWNNLALPTRKYALAAIDSAKASVDSLSDSANPDVASIEALLSKASDQFTGENQRWWHRWADYLFWNRGQEMVGWAYVHEAEERIVFFLPADRVRAGLERAESQLRQAATPPAVAIADRINEALAATPALPADKCRPLLTQVLPYLQSDADLSERVRRALDPGSSVTVADCQKILQDAATALEPTATAKLANQIDEALKAANTLTPLLEHASKLLHPHAAAALAKKITNTLAADPPATIDQLKPILEEIAGYLKPSAGELADRVPASLGCPTRRAHRTLEGTSL